MKPWWYAPAPAERLATVRWITGGFAIAYLLARASHIARAARFPPERFDPVGVVSLLDAPTAPWVLYAALAATIALGVLFTAGWRFRITGPAFALGLLWVLTYRNSWNKVFHTENLIALYAIVLALSPAADALSADARRRGATPGPHPRYGWPLKLMAAVLVLSYFLAALAKLRASGLAWLDPDWMRNWVAYDNLRKIAHGDWHSPFGAALVAYRWVWAPLAIVAIGLELGAPVALAGRRIARWWSYGMLAFHFGVWILMGVLFPFHVSGAAFAPLWRAEKLPAWIARRRRR